MIKVAAVILPTDFNRDERLIGNMVRHPHSNNGWRV